MTLLAASADFWTSVLLSNSFVTALAALSILVLAWESNWLLGAFCSNWPPLVIAAGKTAPATVYPANVAASNSFLVAIDPRPAVKPTPAPIAVIAFRLCPIGNAVVGSSNPLNTEPAPEATASTPNICCFVSVSACSSCTLACFWDAVSCSLSS